MAVQTTYNENIAAGFHGMIADTAPNELFSRSAEVALGFGEAVIQGTLDNQCNDIVDSDSVLIGITVRTVDQEADSIAVEDAALLMRRGSMWVTVTDAGGVSAGDPVWVLVADGTFSNADAGSDGSIRINNARWETSAANGALARIWFDLAGGVTAGAS
jgi:hypothetical protein